MDTLAVVRDQLAGVGVLEMAVVGDWLVGGGVGVI